MSMEITQILLAAQSPYDQIRTAAESRLRQYQEKNLPHYLLALSVELSNDQKPTESRRLAGIILKNSLDAKNFVRKEQLAQQWVNVDLSIKFQIKESLLRTLWSSVSEARHTSSQVIAKVASIEIPRQEGQELVAMLLNNMTRQDSTASLKQATLEALGYACEEIAPQDLEQDKVDAVLTAIVEGMNQANHNSEVRLAAVRALYNAVDFARTNFENELERDYIMKVVCEAAVSKEVEIRQASFECLVAIASTYYGHLGPYMLTIFDLTAIAVKADEEPVALQAIEFWSTVCDEEIELQEKYEETEDGRTPFLCRFVEKALPYLVPMLLETLVKQEEEQFHDDSIWNLSMAGGTCLGLVARAVGDAVVPLVMPFVHGNLTKPDWHNREAATFAFGSILEGIFLEQIAPIVHTVLDFFLNAMKDQNSQVKDTAAWTLGRIFEVLHSPTSAYPIITSANLPRIMSVLLESIRDVPSMAEKVCGAIYFLAQGYEHAGSSSSLLTPYFGELVLSLLCTADRIDTNNSRLRASAYETLNALVRCSNVPEPSNIIGQLLHEIMKRLSQTLELQIISSDDRVRQSDLQALLCGVLQVIIQKLGSSDAKSIILQSADQMMILFLRVFACHSTTVHEEAMLAIGALAYATGSEFEKYMAEFYKYLELGLQNFEEYQVCSISIGVVGDICHALDDKVIPFCDAIMSALLKDLSNPMLHHSVKPLIFSCFGYIALAIGEHFEKYLPYAIPRLQGAAELCCCLNISDDHMFEYENQLREGIFAAYSGILQGFKNSKPELMMPYASHLLWFTEYVFRYKSRDDGVTKAAISVMGDLADTLGPNMKDLFENYTFHDDFLRECFQSDDEQLKETATWTQGMIRRVFV